MKHKIINHGPLHIIVRDTDAMVHKIGPGCSAVLELISIQHPTSIQHGSGPAHYQVEPADDPPVTGREKSEIGPTALDPSKPMQTRDGRRVHIDSLGGLHPITGRILNGDGSEYNAKWTDEGRCYYPTNIYSRDDLINAPSPEGSAPTPPHAGRWFPGGDKR